jgi:hypothetical protein
MNTFRANPVVRVLTAIVSMLYGAAWVAGTIVFVAILAVELFAVPETRQKLSIGVTTTVELEPRTIGTVWGGPLRLKMDEAKGSLRVPIGSAPLGFRLATYLGLAVIYVLFMKFLFRLRELLRRVRAGAPFDERNATSLRWLGLMLILIDTLASVYSFALSQMVLRAMSPATMPVTSQFSMNGNVIFVGLVLLALAEIFRRGAVLEDEHAHLV